MLGGENETLDYGEAQTYYPWAVMQNVCDSLVTRVGGPPQLVLAEEVTPNEDSTEWTITLREGPTFHDGTPVTADDVAASIEYFAASTGMGGFYSMVDTENMQVVDDRTLTVPLTEPRADFVETVLSVASVVYQDGGGAAESPGCSGAFTLESYSPESGAILERYDDYWGEPASLERLELRKVPDATARVNALISGEADLAFDVPPSTADAVTGASGYQVLESEVTDSSAFYFALNTRMAPFDDPEVRRALKLAVDREQMVEVVFGGYGQVGNDLFGKDLPGYLDDSAEQREQDLDEAQRILEEAGVTELSLVVAEGSPGLTGSADLLTQQLADIGVTVNVTEIDPGTWFSDLEGLYESQIITWYAANQPPLAGLDTWLGEENPFNYTGWAPEEYTQLVAEARASTDESERDTAVEQMQQLQWDDGGYVVWGYRNQLSGAVEGLEGVELNAGTPLFSNATLN